MIKTVVNNPKLEVKTERSPTHFIFVLDNSGSMYGSIESMKQDLKNKLSTLVDKKDAVSIITFSSSNDVRVVMSWWTVDSISDDVQIFHKAIDNHVSARWCTSFNKALEKVSWMIDNMQASVLFLTDWYHNDWGSKYDVLDVVDKLSKLASNFTVVEYGDYCDHRFLVEIVEAASKNTVANHMYQGNVRYFEPVMKSFVNNEVMSSKFIEHEIHDNEYDFVFSWTNRFFMNWNVVRIPEDLWEFNYVPKVNNDTFIVDVSTRYSLLYHLASMRMIDDLYKWILSTWDKYIWELMSNSFWVEYTRATEYIKECITDSSKRYILWQSDSAVPTWDVYCVMNLLDDLAWWELVISADEFNYNRVSRKMVQKSSVITDEERASIKKVSDLKDLEKTKYELKFVPYSKDLSYPLNTLVWNTSRANISFQTMTKWTVDVSNVTWNTYGLKEVPTFIYRNYTIIQDGRKNITKLPVRIDNDILDSKWIKYETVNDYHVIDISDMPVINRDMVSAWLSSVKFIEDIINYETTKAEIKVLKSMKEEEEEDLYKNIYTEEQIEWLKSIGLSKNGFAPQMVWEESTDSYMAQCFNYKIKWLSSLPKISESIDNPTTLWKKLIANAYNRYKNTDVTKNLIKAMQNYKQWLERNISWAVFGLIMSQKWFNDLEEWAIVTKEIEGLNFEISFVAEEKEVKI